MAFGYKNPWEGLVEVVRILDGDASGKLMSYETDDGGVVAEFFGVGLAGVVSATITEATGLIRLTAQLNGVEIFRTLNNSQG